jgi:hypothetical protein
MSALTKLPSYCVLQRRGHVGLPHSPSQMRKSVSSRSVVRTPTRMSVHLSTALSAVTIFTDKIMNITDIVE